MPKLRLRTVFALIRPYYGLIPAIFNHHLHLHGKKKYILTIVHSWCQQTAEGFTEEATDHLWLLLNSGQDDGGAESESSLFSISVLQENKRNQ